MRYKNNVVVVIRGAHGSGLSGSGGSGSGLSGFGFENVMPNPTELFSDLYIFGFRIFGFVRVGCGRVRVGIMPFSGFG